MPIGELVMYRERYSRKEPSLGVITEIHEGLERCRYTVEWISNDCYKDISTEDGSTITILRKEYAKWKEKNVESIQKEKEGTTTKSG